MIPSLAWAGLDYPFVVFMVLMGWLKLNMIREVSRYEGGNSKVSFFFYLPD
jgi:hypothetical protein